MRTIRTLALSATIVLVGCTPAANDATTTESPTSTTSVAVESTTTSTTTTTTATTTTAAPNDPWWVDFPTEANVVGDLPAVLTDQIGAPEPDPVLTIEGSDDLEDWVSEWLHWFSWVNANPVDGLDALGHGVMAGGAFYEDTVTALESRVDEGTRLLGFAFVPIEVSATFDEFFERGELLRLLVVAGDTIPRYIVDESGSVVTVHEPGGGETSLRLFLRFRESEEEWVLEILEVAG